MTVEQSPTEYPSPDSLIRTYHHMRPISVVLPLALLLAPLTAMAEPDPRTVPLAEEHPLYLDTQGRLRSGWRVSFPA